MNIKIRYNIGIFILNFGEVKDSYRKMVMKFWKINRLLNFGWYLELVFFFLF